MVILFFFFKLELVLSIPEANIDLALERGFDQSMKRTELIKELLGEKEELLRKNQIQRVEVIIVLFHPIFSSDCFWLWFLCFK
jgi:hypothetical protein